jgi:hypothetical protein
MQVKSIATQRLLRRLGQGFSRRSRSPRRRAQIPSGALSTLLLLIGEGLGAIGASCCAPKGLVRVTNHTTVHGELSLLPTCDSGKGPA